MIDYRLYLAPALGGLLCAAAPPVSFTPAEPQFDAAAAEYRELWAAEGQRIINALETAAGAPFPTAPIEMIVYGGRPIATIGENSIWLNAGYPSFYKRATLVHELGHRLAFTMPSGDGIDDHRHLYLFLYEAWVELYGHDFAGRMVRIERGIPGDYDYDAAWSWALAMTPDERRARLRAMQQLGTAP